jgi:hypothetical protein
MFLGAGAIGDTFGVAASLFAFQVSSQTSERAGGATGKNAGRFDLFISPVIPSDAIRQLLPEFRE